jgi:nucleoside-diphosphate-sugar epimerase
VSVAQLPEKITTVAELEDQLSRPTDYVVETIRQLDGDMLILGVAGKMGPTLARMAKRASDAAGKKRRVIGVARFSNPSHQSDLGQLGIETVRADLLDQKQLDALPDAPNVVYMPAMKFGSSGQEALTWAMNTYLAGMCAQRYCKSRIVAFSTGNVYGLSPVVLGGSTETATLNPLGDYAQSCLGRERMFEHFSRTLKIPTALIRLNYATELRYGVMVDMAQKVFAGETIDLAMGSFNAIWQGDANGMTLASFAHVASPPFVLNVAGPELLSVRAVCEEFGRLMNKPVTFTGTESPDALISNGQLGHRLFGYPRVPVAAMMRWIATWVMSGGASLGKPTHFETRDGKY